MSLINYDFVVFFEVLVKVSVWVICRFWFMIIIWVIINLEKILGYIVVRSR